MQVFLFSNWRAFRSGGTFDKSEAEAELQPHLNTMLRQELAHYTTAGIIVAISEAERMCACAVQPAACLCWCWRCCCCTFWLRVLTVTCAMHAASDPSASTAHETSTSPRWGRGRSESFFEDEIQWRTVELSRYSAILHPRDTCVCPALPLAGAACSVRCRLFAGLTSHRRWCGGGGVQSSPWGHAHARGIARLRGCAVAAGRFGAREFR